MALNDSGTRRGDDHGAVIGNRKDRSESRNEDENGCAPSLSDDDAIDLLITKRSGLTPVLYDTPHQPVA